MQLDGLFKWIAHYIDHWSKFHVIFPLERKSGALVAEGLKTHVFSVFGTPKILQHDNGREFMNDIVRSTVNNWPGKAAVYFFILKLRQLQVHGRVMCDILIPFGKVAICAWILLV